MRRSLQGASVSFFAFQDIIMGVSGVLLFVVLTLALEQATLEVRAVDRSVDVSVPLDEFRRHLADAEARLAFDSAAYASRLREDTALARDAEAAAQRLEREAVLRQDPLLDGRIRNARDDASRARREIEESERRVAELAEVVESARRAPRRVEYVQDEEGRRDAVVFQCAGTEILVQPLDRNRPLQRLSGTGSEALLRSARAELTKLDRRDSYALILLKPSAATYAAELLQAAREAGVPFGYDPLLEEQRVLEAE